jgi:hypothetical protein
MWYYLFKIIDEFLILIYIKIICYLAAVTGYLELTEKMITPTLY